MATWYLIIAIVSATQSTGLSSGPLQFTTEAACIAAADKVREDLNGSWQAVQTSCVKDR